MLKLTDGELQLAISAVDGARELGRLARTCSRLRRIVNAPAGQAYRAVRRADHPDLAAVEWDAQPALHRLNAPAAAGTVPPAARALAHSSALIMQSSTTVALWLFHLDGADSIRRLNIKAEDMAQSARGNVQLAVYHGDASQTSLGGFVVYLPHVTSRRQKVSRVRSWRLHGKGKWNAPTLSVTGRLVSLAANERFVASVSEGEGVIELWDAATRRVVRRIAAHERGSTVTALLLRGGLAISGASDGTAAVHVAGDALPSAALVAESDAAASCAGGDDEGVWDAEYGAACVLSLRASEHAVTCLDLSGHWLLTGGGRSPSKLWALSVLGCAGTGRRLLQTLPWLGAQGQAANVLAVSLLVDTAVALATSDSGVAVRQWSVPRGQVLYTVVQGVPANIVEAQLCGSGALLRGAEGELYSLEWPVARDARRHPVYEVSSWVEPAPVAAGEVASEGFSMQLQEQIRLASAEAVGDLAGLAVASDIGGYMAGVLEAISTKILHDAANAARENRVGRIEPQHVRTALNRQPQLASLSEIAADALNDPSAAPSGGDDVAGGHAVVELEIEDVRAEAERAPMAATTMGNAAAAEAETRAPVTNSGTLAPSRLRFDAVLHEHIGKFAPKVEAEAAGYMAAVLDAISGKLLDGAAAEARGCSARRIEPQHIHQAISRDAELVKLLAVESGSSGNVSETSPDPIAAETR